MSEANVTHLSLHFPHGISVSQVEYLVRRIQNVIGHRVSEGGFMPKGDFGIQDGVEFHDEAMTYTFGCQAALNLKDEGEK